MHLPWRDQAPAAGGPPISTSITLQEADELARLAAGKRVLEIGSAYGYSTIVMALAGAKVTAVDPHQWLGSYGVLVVNLDSYDVTSQVDVRVGAIGDVVPDLVEDGSGFDLVFIDGDHAEHAVASDVSAAVKLLRPGGTIACHDYGEDCCCPGVRAFLDKAFPDGPLRLVDTLFVVKL